MGRWNGALDRLDSRFGIGGLGHAPGDTRISYLRRLSTRRAQNWMPPEVLAEVVSLHERVAALEAEVASLRRERP